MTDSSHHQRVPAFRERLTPWWASLTKWASRPKRGRRWAWPVSHVTLPTHGQRRPTLGKWRYRDSRIGRDSARGYISLSMYSTLHLGRSRPIGSVSMELGTARPPHRHPGYGTLAQYRVYFPAILSQLRCPAEGCQGTLSSRTNLLMNFSHRHPRDSIVIL